MYRGFRSSFPDLVFDRIDGFMDLPLTGNRVSFPVVLVFTLRDGKILEQQRVYDFTGMLVEADVLKAKPL